MQTRLACASLLCGVLLLVLVLLTTPPLGQLAHRMKQRLIHEHKGELALSLHARQKGLHEHLTPLEHASEVGEGRSAVPASHPAR
jgi:adenine C2-methylase RlmN of 23S rRNA A2503 and tRNA A37